MQNNVIFENLTVFDPFSGWVKDMMTPFRDRVETGGERDLFKSLNAKVSSHQTFKFILTLAVFGG